MTIPMINPSVKYRTVSALKKLLLPDLTATLASPVVITDGEGEPVAILVPFESYIELQTTANGDAKDT